MRQLTTPEMVSRTFVVMGQSDTLWVKEIAVTKVRLSDVV